MKSGTGTGMEPMPLGFQHAILVYVAHRDDVHVSHGQQQIKLREPAQPKTDRTQLYGSSCLAQLHDDPSFYLFVSYPMLMSTMLTTAVIMPSTCSALGRSWNSTSE